MRLLLLALVSASSLPAASLVGSRSPRLLSRRSSARQRILASDDEGYGPVGSLLRQGPLPFFQRIANPAKYEQSVAFYMEENRCGRTEAQGNMDAFLANPNDWAMIKMRAKKGGFEPDFANANLDPKTLVLTGVWSAGLALIVFRIIAVNGPAFLDSLTVS